MLSWGLLVASVIGPFVVVLAHELGHAAFVLWASEERVHVSVGKSPPLFEGSWGRLDLSLNLQFERGAASGIARAYVSFSWGDYVAFALAGPFANLVLSFLCVPFLYDSLGHPRWSIFALAGISAFTVVANLAPYTRNGMRSDGQVALDAWRARRDISSYLEARPRRHPAVFTAEREIVRRIQNANRSR